MKRIFSNSEHMGAVLVLLIGASALVSAQTSNSSGDIKSAHIASAADPAAANNNTNEPTVALSTKAHDNSFVIGADDVLSVNVWKEPEISRAVPVRSDGKISLPLVGELQASGQTPRQLEAEIAGKLESYVSEPEVTVIVQQIKSQKFNLMGQIARPGAYTLTGPMTVLDAIALGGGFRDFAKQKSIYILRQNPDGTESRLPFNYKEVIKGKNMSQNITLQTHDTIVVP
jgi:polysaccharide export outer membrane protein